MSTGRASHDSDPVRIQSFLCSLTPYDSDRALKILPSRSMLRQTIRTWTAIFKSHHSHAFLIEVPSYRSCLPAVWIVSLISSARIHNLYCIGFQFLRNMPFYIWQTLIFLKRRYLSFWINILFLIISSSIVAGISVQEFLTWLQFSHRAP